MLRRRFAIVSSLALLIVSGCSGHDRQGSVPRSPESLSPIVGDDGTGSSIVQQDAGTYSGPAPTPADLEAGYTTLVLCLTDAGLSGSFRFDASRGTTLVQDVTLGRTEAEAAAGSSKLDDCLKPFESLRSAYDLGHPQTKTQIATTLSRLRLCGDQLFPGQLPSDIGLDEFVAAYDALSGKSGSLAGQDCRDDAFAGPKRPFGTS